MRVLIFANGEISDYSFIFDYFTGNEIIICCDGGVRHTLNLSVIPNFIIGDFDSSDKKTLDYYKENKIPFIPFPVEKDYTDLELCLNFAINRNAKEIIIFGGIGSRFDHSLTNAHILTLALKKRIKALLVNENNIIQLIDDEITLEGNINDIVSLIPLSTEVRGIVTEGLAYPLNNESLIIGSSRGVSNYFISTIAKIKIRDGLLFVIQSKDI